MQKAMTMSLSHRNELSLEGVTSCSLSLPAFLTVSHGWEGTLHSTRRVRREQSIHRLMAYCVPDYMHN